MKIGVKKYNYVKKGFRAQVRQTLWQLTGEKTGFVNWHNSGRKEKYGVIAKKIQDKNGLRGNGFLVYDFEDLKKYV